MPRSMPDASTLLASVINYLNDELMGTLTGYHRFQTRVAINIIGAVRRELELYDHQALAERSRLASILGHDGDVDSLSAELSQQIRDGVIALDNADLRAFLRQSLETALAINNPRWIGASR